MCKSKDKYTFKKINTFSLSSNFMRDASDDNFIFNESVLTYRFNQDNYTLK